MKTVQKSTARLQYRRSPIFTFPQMLCLNLPPMVAQKALVYGLVLLVLGAALCGGSYLYLRAYQAPPTLKIGLVAPFEGLYRASGYEVLFAAKLALQERNAGPGVEGYRVELVALNDFNDAAEAAKQARALVVDSAVVGVIGHLTPETTQAALPIYHEAQLAVAIPWSVEAATVAQANGAVSLAATIDETNRQLNAVTQGMGIEPSIISKVADWEAVLSEAQAVTLATAAVPAGNILVELRQASPETAPAVFGQVEAGNLQLVQVAGDAANGFTFVSAGPGPSEVAEGSTFVEAYRAMTGFLPGPRAALAYDATNVLLDSLEQAIIKNDGNWQFKQSNRADVSVSTITVQRQGVTGSIAFNPDGLRIEAPVWVYRISETTYPGTVIDP